MTACLVGWGHTRFGRLAVAQVPGASTAAVFDMGGMAVANYAGILAPPR